MVRLSDTARLQGARGAGAGFLGDLFETLTTRGRRLLGWPEGADREGLETPDLSDLGQQLLSRRGEASGVVLARALLAAYADADPEARLAFLRALARTFGPDPQAVAVALARIAQDPESREALAALHAAAEPRRQELFRRLNLAPGGTAALVRMREDVLQHMRGHPDLRSVDHDFAHLFASWFNRGFLTLRHIDWNTPASILEKIIRYEAVHAIQNWDDLRNRLHPVDRRCYGFFHPQLVDEPLIFVEVALTKDVPASIGGVLDLSRQPIRAEEADTAVFYSISNTQRGLAGVSFGNFLIKQVVEELKADVPGIKTFVTLSPAPGFAAWLDAERKAATSAHIRPEHRQIFAALDEPGWHERPATAEALRGPLLACAARYFLRAQGAARQVLDPVARFHLGNGARLERLNHLGDISAKGVKQSYGLMVNYLYDPDQIEANHEGFAERSDVAASEGVRSLLATGTP
ncbi:malonyl-CoA decarboxylase [Pseudorhodobacter sp. MZDSW-24AT]|uniref:malonyl-CoA decarboxylase n=1 Tax=Pseudorhodobacter sp. MZDSW-24AT TaxID=2052957 RepID=UPI000C1F886F|nr:malonyl-CoA decarboxylase [Pseudorhodobacter sp. MZDSW-24AT]PJF08447.1 MCD, Malonyl-CoA decarboxylase MCD [Pseudorhodobacter sp. MZDSW-24AT]